MKRLALISMLCVGCADSVGEVYRIDPGRPQQIRTVARNGSESIIEVDYGGETHAFLASSSTSQNRAMARIGSYPSKAPVRPKP